LLLEIWEEKTIKPAFAEMAENYDFDEAKFYKMIEDTAEILYGYWKFEMIDFPKSPGPVHLKKKLKLYNTPQFGEISLHLNKLKTDDDEIILTENISISERKISGEMRHRGTRLSVADLLEELAFSDQGKRAVQAVADNYDLDVVNLSNMFGELTGILRGNWIKNEHQD
jgi:uncharacterized protein (DUF433 family)